MDLASAGSVIIASTAAAPCPANDSTTLVLAGKVYRFSDPGRAYSVSKAKCAELESYPVVFNSWKEHLAVETYFGHHQDMMGYWLGLRQAGNNGVW
jgi:hypothetical protein